MKIGNKIVLILIGVVMLLSLATVGVLSMTASNGTIATISVYGEVKKEIDLSKVLKPTDYHFENTNGGKNTIHVENGEIAITEANCPDHLCVQRGPISTNTVPIVCLPNGVLIEIKGDNAIDPEIDTLSE